MNVTRKYKVVLQKIQPRKTTISFQQPAQVFQLLLLTIQFQTSRNLLELSIP